MRAGGWALAAAALLATGCGADSLEDTDPNGYEACQTYAEVSQINDDPLARVGGSLEAAEIASRAETADIRDAAQPVGDSWLLDGDAMQAACADNGVEIP